ncbi:hypothetical protein ACU8KH_01168 [Lachancea thermotolerans]
MGFVHGDLREARISLNERIFEPLDSSTKPFNTFLGTLRISSVRKVADTKALQGSKAKAHAIGFTKS